MSHEPENAPLGDELEGLLSYLDGEMSPDARRAMEDRLERDDALRARVDLASDELGALGALVVGSLESEADAVHEARFEQIWDAVEREISRDAEAAEAPPTASGPWARIVDWLRPARLPLGLAAAGAAAALVLVVVRGPGDPASTVAQGPEDSDATQTEKVAEPAMETAPAPDTRIADADAPPASLPEPLPVPDSNEADVERIEFGGASGRTLATIATRRVAASDAVVSRGESAVARDGAPHAT